MDQGRESAFRTFRRSSGPCFWAILLLVLAGSCVVRDAMGLAFALACAAGLWGLGPWQHRTPWPAWLKIWLMACTLALVLRGIGTFYWDDPLSARHAELKLLLGALSAAGLWRLVRQRPDAVVAVSHGFTLALLTGLAWVWPMGREHLVTHPIPWANAIALITCWLLAVSVNRHYRPAQRLTWLAGSMAGLLAVLLSQSRGAYAVVAWWIAVMGWQGWRTLRSPQAPAADKRLVWQATAGGLLTALILLASPGMRETLHLRVVDHIQTAASEVEKSTASPTEGANSSVGSRLYMWQNSLPVIADSPWIGHGKDTRQKLIRSWGEEAHSDEVHRLRHLHNEYLNALMDHGLLGLASLLTYLGTLWALTWLLKRQQKPTASLALAGMTLVLMMAGLSNVNMVHNFYTAAVSLMLSLTLALLPATDP